MTLGRETQEIGQGSSLFLISVMCSGFRAAVFFALPRPPPRAGGGGGGRPCEKTERGADPRISENLRPI